jgi:hypothetical protein
MELPPSSKYVARRDETVSNDERESLAKRLASEFEAGRISQDEYLRTLDQLYEAKTLGELVPVVSRVPDTTSDTPAIVETGTGEPGELAPINSGWMQPLVVGGVALAAVAALLLLLFILL